MMTYISYGLSHEDCRELKEAGFPQHEKEIGANYSFPAEIGPSTMDLKCYLPSLGELIKACGDDFEALIKQAGGWGAISSREGYRKGSGSATGDTQERAVKNLWIKLNQK